MHAQFSESNKRPRSGLTSIVLALLGPPVLGVIFMPVFRSIQETFGPKGNLEGRDLTAYANRDELVFKAFVAVLVVYSLVVAWRAPGWTFRSVAFAIAVVISIVTVVGVFFSLMAP